MFGGNFLHDYAIPMQLRVHKSESRTKIARKFRYPNFADIHWYVAAAFVDRVLGHCYIDHEFAKQEIESGLAAFCFNCSAICLPIAAQNGEQEANYG